MDENIINYTMIQSLSLSWAWVLVVLLLGGSPLAGQEIFLDETFEDWTDEMVVFSDIAGDAQPNRIDLQRIWAANDQEYIYFRIELGREINLQDDNDLALYIDADNNFDTGRKINGVGAELIWNFGDRFGQLYDASGDNIFIDHEEIDLMSSPTVSSTEFEIGFRRQAFIDGSQLDIRGTIAIRVEDNDFLGDDAPDAAGGFTYEIKEGIVRNFDGYSLDRTANTHLRVLTYNILDDNLFDNSRSDAFRRQLQAINPDVICLQEVRDFTGTATRDRVSQWLPGEWFQRKSSFGNVVTLSRYPLLESEGMDGNQAHLIEVSGQEVLIINMHLPCCDNNADRQREVDNIMDYIRDAREGGNDFQIADGTPIIIMGDSNLVGLRAQQQTLLTGDILNNSQFGPDFAPDWDGSNLDDAKPLATGTPYTKTWYNPFGSFSSGRLDYIIYTGSVLQLENTFALSTRDMAPADRQQYGLSFADTENASDHLPTVADFGFEVVTTADVYVHELSLYPNPVIDMLRLSRPVNATGYIYDVNGQLVETVTVASGETFVRQLARGAYVLRVAIDDGYVHLPFVKI